MRSDIQNEQGRTIKALVATPRGQLTLILLCVALWASSIALRDVPAWTVCVAVLTVPLWTWVKLYKIFPRNLVLRRSSKFIPYLVPLFTFGIDLRVSWSSLALCLIFAVAYLSITKRAVKEALNPTLLSMMPRSSFAENLSEAIFFGGSAIAQEYLHRFVFVVFLTSLGAPEPLIVLLTTASFVIEHFVGKDGGHTAKSKSNIALWASLGLVNGVAAVYLGPALLACMLAHLCINGPATVRPFLRGRSS